MRLALVAVAATLMSACAINLRYQPPPQAAAAEGRKPKIYLTVVDHSEVGFRNVIHTGDPIPSHFSRPPKDSLREALGAVFDRLGVPLVNTQQGADASMTATIKDISLDNFGRGTTGGGFKIGVVVKTRGNAQVYNDDVVGHGDMMSGPTGPSKTLNQAFESAINQIEDLFLNQDLAGQIFAAGSQVAAAPVAAAPAIQSDIDALPNVKPIRRSAHAVLIGIENYRQQLPRADFAAGDARLMAKYLTGVLGYPAENVAVLTNDGATRSDIEKYIERWLPNRVAAGDSVFVYYSGHGSPNPTTGDAYMVAYDGDPTYLEQTSYPLSRLYGALAKLPTKDVTVVLDSCFSGAGGRSVIAKGARPLVNVKSATAVPGSLTVLSAAGANQISQTYQEKGHGLFTYFLLKGIGQQAAKGAVSFKDAFDFAAPQVTKIAREDYNSEQTPQWQEGFR